MDADELLRRGEAVLSETRELLADTARFLELLRHTREAGLANRSGWGPTALPAAAGAVPPDAG